MPTALPACPFLPAARPGLDWRTLHVHREDVRGAEFYHDCLEYAQALWQRRLAARALLCLDRAMGADLDGSDPVLREWHLRGQPAGAFPALRRPHERAPA